MEESMIQLGLNLSLPGPSRMCLGIRLELNLRLSQFYH